MSNFLTRNSRFALFLFVLLVCFGAVLIVGDAFDIKALFERVAESEHAPLAFLGLYVLTCLFLLPGGVLTVGAGLLFGIKEGIFLVSTGATIGASLAFFVSRYLARDWVASKIAANERLVDFDKRVAEGGWKFVLIARLTPIVPFRFSNYFFGTTGIRFREYFFATWLGTIPSATVTVSSAAYLRDLAEADELRLFPMDANVILKFLAVVVLLLVFLIWRQRRKLRLSGNCLLGKNEAR